MSSNIAKSRVEYKGFAITLTYKKYDDEEGWDFSVRPPKDLELYGTWDCDWLQPYDDALKNAESLINRRVREAVKELEAELKRLKKHL